jgi:nitrate reductase gamma subunit
VNQFIFGTLPYIALTILIVGSIVRYERDPFTWKSSSSQLLRRRQLMIGSVLFHAGILVVFFGHLVGMLTPPELLHLFGIGYGFKQAAAIVVGGIAGLAAIAGGAMLLHRRLTDARVRATSSFADTAILAILFVQVVIGMGTTIVSVQHLDGGEMVKFMDWARGSFTFRTDAWTIVADVHWIYKLHIALGLTIFILFPFTRLVHMLSAPVRYVWRPWQVVRARKAVIAPVDAPRPVIGPAAAPLRRPAARPAVVAQPAE